MGIFRKKQKDFSSEFESLEFGSENLPSNQSKPAINYAGGNARASNGKYSIDQAIKLVRSLREHKVNAVIIAQIMQQTLESVDIHFNDIISDANRKESAIVSETERKDQEIQELNRKFEALRDEKQRLQRELQETMAVREFLQQAVADEAPAAQPAPAPQAQHAAHAQAAAAAMGSQPAGDSKAASK